jgi:hypothetical protein
VESSARGVDDRVHPARSRHARRHTAHRPPLAGRAARRSTSRPVGLTLPITHVDRRGDNAPANARER